jgi:hypothetical protein
LMQVVTTSIAFELFCQSSILNHGQTSFRVI